MTERKKSGLAAALEGKTATLGEKLDKNPNPSGGIQDQPPVTMPGQLGAFRLQAQQWQKRLHELEVELREAREKGGALELDVDNLIEVPGRRRKLTPEEYNELKENLRQHDLITPITVRVVGEGTYEIVSGHNRVAIYKELGRKKIKAWLGDTDTDKTEELAFYANLLHPDLSAFEKYTGLKKVMEANPGITTHEQLAARTGLSRSHVTELMAFDGLPESVREALKKKPSAISAKTAAKLANVAEKGGAERVLQAVEKAVAENIEQQEVVRLATANQEPSATTPKRAEPVKIKAGKRTYCSLVGTRKTLRLDFASEDERAEAESRVAVLLEDMAREKKG